MGNVAGVAGEVEHLSEYYRHLTTISAGAIVVVGIVPPKAAGAASLVVALVLLGICIVASTLMMWAYGVARREAANEAGSAERPGRWAYLVSARSLWFAKRWVGIGSMIAPGSFAVGFLLLALYAVSSVL